MHEQTQPFGMSNGMGHVCLSTRMKCELNHCLQSLLQNAIFNPKINLKRVFYILRPVTNARTNQQSQ